MLKRQRYSLFYCSTKHYGQQPEYGSSLNAINKLMDKPQLGYIPSGILFGHKKPEIRHLKSMKSNMERPGGQCIE